MDIFTLSREIKMNYSEDDSVELLKYKYSKILNLYGFVTGIESFGISFKRKIRITTHTGENRIDALKIFREGKVILTVVNNQLKVRCLVQLDTLYFLTFLIGILIIFATKSLFEYSLNVSIFVGTLSFLISILIGIIIIDIRIREFNTMFKNIAK